jgi:aminoglycoside phosphotransferase (APT) family kinase protein
MPGQKMHPGEMDITVGLVAGLIAGQFPQWASLPIRPVVSAGTVHVMFRLGADMAVRLPRVPPGSDALIAKRLWLPRLVPYLPVAVPAPIGEGRPTQEYPGSWSVLRWLGGANPVADHLAAPGLLAADLAEFVAACRKIDLTGGPAAYRGGPLAELSEETLGAIEELHGLVDTDLATAVWRDAARLPQWSGPGVWVHADLMPGNLLTVGGRLSAVIDFDAAGIGDPACDLIVAWNLLPASVRTAYRRAVGVDEATWTRGRGRALSMALIQLPYYQDTNPVMAANARHTIREVLADHQDAT